MAVVLLIIWLLFVALFVVGIVHLVKRRWVSGAIFLVIGLIGGIIAFSVMIYQFTYGT